MLWQRLLTAAIGIPAMLGVVYAGGRWLGGAVALLALVGLREFFALTTAARAGADSHNRNGTRLLHVLGYGFALCLPLVHTVWPEAGAAARLLAVALPAAALLAIVRWRRSSPSSPRVATAVAGLGALIVPSLFTYLVELRNLGAGPVLLSGLNVRVAGGTCWLFLVLASCWAADTAAYAVGKKWGRRKLCPAISPGKTVEGAIAGLIGSLLATAAFGFWFGLPLAYGASLGGLLGVAGQLGDLAESKLKRWAGVKDSGALLPGHGGVLDRFDSLLLNAPVGFYYLRAVLGG